MAFAKGGGLATSQKPTQASECATLPSFQTRSFSYEPSDESRPAPPPARSFFLNVGDEAVVTTDEAKLMIGCRVLGTVSKGKRIGVSEVEGTWVWATVEVSGQPMAGWIRVDDLRPTTTKTPNK
jgi:hypothetical protein